jgi:alkanesulfonate monooxygenase SsuD/methylene tetrahydromethanopterin reductase-like flavin-dependent oxidoreductase (luciferase family)
MWAGDRAPYNGRHYQLADPLNSAQPLSRPHPPILVGGGGERKTLRLVAQYADACNLFTGRGMEPVRTELDVLRRHCDDLGRDYATIEKTTLSGTHLAPGQQTAADVLAHLRALADLGVQHVVFNMPNVQELTLLEVFGREIIPEVAEW